MFRSEPTAGPWRSCGPADCVLGSEQRSQPNSRLYATDGTAGSRICRRLDGKDVRTTMICIHVLDRGLLGVHSPIAKL